MASLLNHRAQSSISTAPQRRATHHLALPIAATSLSTTSGSPTLSQPPKRQKPLQQEQQQEQADASISSFSSYDEASMSLRPSELLLQPTTYWHSRQASNSEASTSYPPEASPAAASPAWRRNSCSSSSYSNGRGSSGIMVGKRLASARQAQKQLTQVADPTLLVHFDILKGKASVVAERHQQTARGVGSSSSSNGSAGVNGTASRTTTAANSFSDPTTEAAAASWEHIPPSSASSSSSSASSPLVPSSSSGSSKQQQQQLLQLLRSPASGFSDVRFEKGLSRWVQDAPDWFAIRALHERWSNRMNIVNLSLAVARLADLTSYNHLRMMKQEAAAFKSFLAQLLASVRQKVPAADAKTGVLLLHALAVLHQNTLVPPDEELIQAILQYMMPYMGALQPKEMCSLLWSMQKLKAVRVPVAGRFLAGLFRVSEPLAGQADTDAVAVMLYSAGKLKVPVPDSWLLPLLTRAEALLPTMRQQHLSMVLLALPRLGVAASSPIIPAVAAELRSRFSILDPQLLSNALWAFATVGYIPDRQWIRQFYIASHALLDCYTPGELSVTVWALSKTRLQPSDLWLDEFFDQSETNWRSYSIQDLALMGYSLARLGLRPPQTWLKRYCAALLRRKSQLTKPYVRQLMVALAAFKVANLEGWRIELYTAAGLTLSRLPRWRQRMAKQRAAGRRVGSSRS